MTLTLGKGRTIVREMEAIEIADRALTARRKIKLEWYERELMKTLTSLASMFRQLRDDPEKPYLATHNSFEEYCLEKWKMTSRRTQQLIAADDLRLLLVDSAPTELRGTINGMHEGQLRELITTPEEKRVEVIREAIAMPEKPGKITAAKIKIAKARIVEGVTRGPALKVKAGRCPHCGREW